MACHQCCRGGYDKACAASCRLKHPRVNIALPPLFLTSDPRTALGPDLPNQAAVSSCGMSPGVTAGFVAAMTMVFRLRLVTSKMPQTT